MIRKQIEEAAWQAREAASQSLLRELEEEEAAATKPQSISTGKDSRKQQKKMRAAQALEEKAKK